MYLREMGSVELLSREGEIAIAKRIEAGREAMIAGLCESPLTFQAIIIWRDELNEGKVFLRDIIDLEATYAGPDAKMPAPVGPDGKPLPGVPGTEFAAAAPQAAPAQATPFKVVPASPMARRRTRPNSPPKADMEDDEFENSMSLAAIEAELKPKVLETFDTVANEYKKLRNLQEQDIANRLQNETLSPSQERKYKKLKDEIITAVKSLRLNQARIDSLVDQLYEINKRLVGLEGRMMRLAESHGVAARRLSEELFRLGARSALAQPRVQARGQGLEEPCRQGQGQGEGSARQHPHAGGRDRPRDRRIPQDRAFGAEGRARSPSGEEGNGGGEPAPRHLDRQEIHQSRPAVPRPHPGRQHRPDEGGR